MCKVAAFGHEKNKPKTRFVLRTIFHVLYAFTNYGVMLYGSTIALSSKQSEVKEIRELKKYTAFFLTNWNYMFQTVFLSLSLLYDSLEWLEKHQSSFGKKLAYIRDIMFSGMVVPFTLFISGMFWCIYAIDRELVFPAVYDEIVPWWFNHCVHTNITVMVLLETLLQARRSPANRTVELALCGGVGVLYAIVYYSIYFYFGRWLYAVFGVMSWWQVCLYQLGIWGSNFLFYFLQFPVNRIFHRKPEAAPSVDIKTSAEGNGGYNTEWGLVQKQEKSRL